MSSPRKSITSRYLENLPRGAAPLQPSAKLNTPTSPTKLESAFMESPATHKKPLLEKRVLILENERAVNLEKSIAELKLDSPSPLKRSGNRSFPKEQTQNLASAPAPQWTLSNRNSQKGYEYLCRIGEAKEWIEKIIGEEIPPASSLAQDALRDGAILAKLTQHFQPQLVKRVIPAGKLRFKHTENINVFFQFLDVVKMPDLFRFELTDLYDKKNIPRVIFCLHALSFMMSQESNTPIMEELSGKLEFSQDEIKKSETSLVGVSLPNFDSMNKQFGRELPKSPQKLKPSLFQDSTTAAAAAAPPPVFPRPALKSPFFEINGPDKITATPKTKLVVPKIETIEIDSDESVERELIRGYQASPRKQKKLSDSDYLQNIIKFQSIARGSIFRYNMFIDKIMLKSMSESIITVQSLARRSIVRRQHKGNLSNIGGLEPSVVEFQARARGKMQRSVISSYSKKQPSEAIVELQSAARGVLVRSPLDRIRRQLSYSETKILQLQSRIRSKKVATKTEDSISVKAPVTGLQAHARRYLLHKKLNRSVREANTSEDAITIIQSYIRGNGVRSEIAEKEEVLTTVEPQVVELQSIIRGGLHRSDLNYTLDNLDIEEPRLNSLCAIARGKTIRIRVARDMLRLKSSLNSVVAVQSQVRGVLSRYGMELFLDEVDYHFEEIVELQSLIRRHLYHKEKREIMRYYENHLPSIIKIQSFIRGKYLGNAYKSLISMPNPPLSVIKRFAHLLSDSDVDFEEEVKLTRLKESINEKTTSNEGLEKHISQLDLKIALLQKNKITLDELLIQKNKGVQQASGSSIDVGSLNKRAKTRMEQYEKFFYLLQTQPSYLTRLMRNDYRGLDVALKLFNNLQSKELPTREEYLFVRLIESVLKDSIMKSPTIHDLQKHQSVPWQRLLRSFNETQQGYLAELFGSMVENILTDADLEMESDPVLIYQKVHNTPKTLPVEKAIEDEKTKAAFISNLQQMREYGSEIFHILNANLNKLPIHIKVLAQSAYVTSMKKFPHQVEQEHLANAGFVLIQGYINLIFETPEFCGITVLNKIAQSSKTLREISRLLIQMFVMKPFGADQVYLQPLNKFINSSMDGVRSLIKSVIDVVEIDTAYNMTVYDDMTAHNRPKLTLRISDMLAINQLVQKEIDSVAPLADDTLREILVEIQSNNASDISRLNGHYTLNLNPSSYKSSPEETRTKALSMQAKRCVLYLVQVQDEYDDLFDLLKSQIDPIHEIKFKQIINNEKKDIKLNHVNDYVNDGQGFLGDLSRVSYHKLKQIALERILELESMGHVNRSDKFQVLSNDIAHDIRTKHDQRLARKKQLSIAENAMIRLDEKHRFLKDQLNAYNHHIDKSMEELQSKPTKQKRIMPFTKQFFYERELKRTGKIPKFGAYKYSAKRLYEKGILVEIRGLDQNLNSSSSNFFGGIAFPKIDFMFQCDRAGVFTVSSKSGTIAVNGGLETLTIDQFLEFQFDNRPHIDLFDGMAKFDTNCLINFIFKKFYHYTE